MKLGKTYYKMWGVGGESRVNIAFDIEHNLLFTSWNLLQDVGGKSRAIILLIFKSIIALDITVQLPIFTYIYNYRASVNASLTSSRIQSQAYVTIYN